MGDLWWYTGLIFLAQRFSDAINMFVGLWLVPKCVPTAELGAVLPLAQFIGLIGLPLGVLAIPFMKYLCVYGGKGEYGKVKSLLRDVFVGTGVLALLTVLIAWLVLPFLFERCRVATGSLGLLIVLGSVIAAVSTIFGNAIQGLKLFDSAVLIGLFSAPVRLATMLVTMPFRPLAGYFAGQAASSGVPVLGALWVLRKRLGRDVKAVPYWKEDGRAMIRYMIPVAILTIVTTVSGSVDSLVIRHRLSDFESAGYYVLTRFTDITSYAGSAFMVLLFPLVAGAEAKSGSSLKVVVHSVLGTTVAGIAVGVGFAFAGAWVLSLTDLWSGYVSLSGLMLPICVLNVLWMSAACLYTYEMAQGRFRFLWYLAPILSVKCFFLYSVTGISFFAGILPAEVIASIAEWHPCRLEFVIWTFIVTNVAILLFALADVFGSRRAETDA